MSCRKIEGKTKNLNVDDDIDAAESTGERVFQTIMDCLCSAPRSIQCKIILLDEHELIYDIQDNNTGQVVLDYVFRHLNLLETTYFGLRYLDFENQTHWLDPEKKLSRQLKGSEPYTLYFGVKFYAADPCKLLEEITRYQFFLQVKQDILQGRLPVSFELTAELGAYIVQSELGDYDPRRHSPGYVSEFRFLSNQTVELESRIVEIHKTLVGQLPSIAELNYLDKVKWLEMYGVDLHPVLGEDNVEYFLGLTPSGIIVLRNKNTVGNYYWPRISKIYFKGRYFMLRVTDKNNDESTYGFETPSKPACKHLWKCCVEHHAFFRLVQVSTTTPDIFSLGSRFRYSGRTEKQAVRDAQLRIRNPPSFSRTSSRRYQKRIVEGVLETPKLDETMNGMHYHSQEIKHVSIPQPAQSFDSPYIATCNVNNIDMQSQRADSPRSTRSAPWSQPHSRGLYNTISPPSPRSVRSAGPRYRSSSIDSQSSTDSKSCKRRRHQRSRWTSDNESELSKCSSRSHRKHRRHRSRGKRDSTSEQDPHVRRHRSLKNKHSESYYELVDSGSQWREIQKKQEDNLSSIQQANVIVNHRSGYVNSGLETETEPAYHYRNKHRKHRSRSRSPSESKTWLPDELKKHLEFDLIDTTGMSESQLREIPYTVVQTNHAKQLKLKHMSWGKSDTLLQNEKHISYSPPPPYSPQASNVTRVRDMRVSHSSAKCDSHMQLLNSDFVNKNGSSVASSSSTHSTLNMIPRMLESLSLSDNNYQYSNRGSKNRMGNSALYCNPNTLLGGVTSGNGLHGGPNMDTATRINHEHSDSGLGAEQECMYGSERSTNENVHQGAANNKNTNGSELRDVSAHMSVSKSNNDACKLLNPHDLYPLSYNATLNPSKSVTINKIPSSFIDTNKNNVHITNMDSRYASSFISKSSSRTSYSHNSANAGMPFNNRYTGNMDLDNAMNSTRSSIRQPFNNASPYSGELSKARLFAADNNAASFIHGSSNFTRSMNANGGCTNDQNNITDTGAGTGPGAGDNMNINITDGPLRLRYRLGHSVRSVRSTRSEGTSRDNSQFIAFNQPVTSTQTNMNKLNIASTLGESKEATVPQNENKANGNANHAFNGPAKPGESTEMSTEL